jgi:hypothetical protein
MNITGTGNRATLTIDGKRIGIWITCGPWAPGIDSALVKIRPKRGHFPREWRERLAIENNSDILSDYFEPDCVRLMPGHALYESARRAAGGTTC